MFFPLKDQNPTSTFPFVTISLIFINAAIFLYQFFLGPAQGTIFVHKLGAIPYEILHIKDIPPAAPIPVPLTLITAMFLHGGFFHLIGNMWFLWIFGNNVEDFLGHFRFFVFYLLSGIAASMFHILIHFDHTIPMIGASGAIAGVMGAYMVLFPAARVHTLVFLIIYVTIVPVPALIWLGLWFLMQVTSAGMGGGVAWYAHIGGFIVGVYFASRALKKKGITRRRVVSPFKRSRRPPPRWRH